MEAVPLFCVVDGGSFECVLDPPCRDSAALPRCGFTDTTTAIQDEPLLNRH